MAKTTKTQPSSYHTLLLLIGLVLAVVLFTHYSKSSTQSSQAGTESISLQGQSQVAKCWEIFKNSEYSKLLDQLTDLLKQRDYWYGVLQDPNSTEAQKQQARLRLWILELEIQDLSARISLAGDIANKALKDCLREAGVELPADR